MGIVEIGGTMLSRAGERVDLAAQNMANLTTPGYKSRSVFPTMLTGQAQAPAASSNAVDFTNGSLTSTGNPLDLAIGGSGFFAVRGSDGVFYTRSGQFSRGSDGKLKTPEGMVLQSVSGDLVLGEGDPTVLADGTVTCEGAPVGRIAVVNFDNQRQLRAAAGALFAAPEASAKPAGAQVHQGMLEASNVSTAAEMISIMSGLRSAGAGQRVVQLYDDLMGRAITAFGQS
jgi:flagellar basal-body rod protein FlgG